MTTVHSYQHQSWCMYRMRQLSFSYQEELEGAWESPQKLSHKSDCPSLPWETVRNRHCAITVTQITWKETYRGFFGYQVSKIIEGLRKSKKCDFGGFQNSDFLKNFCIKLGPDSQKWLYRCLDSPLLKTLQKEFCKNLQNSRRYRDSWICRSESRKTYFCPLCGQMAR